MPFIETIRDIDEKIISEELYNTIKYRTNEFFEIELVKEGISIYLARELNTDNNRQFVQVTEKGISVNEKNFTELQKKWCSERRIVIINLTLLTSSK